MKVIIASDSKSVEFKNGIKEDLIKKVVAEALKK